MKTSSDAPLRIGAAIRLLRRRRRWTQSRLAQEAGSTRSAVADFERGRRSPGIDSADALRRALGVSWAELGLVMDSVEDPKKRAGAPMGGKLSGSDRAEIHRLIEEGRLSQSQIAARYGVTQPLISRIKRRRGGGAADVAP